MQAAYSKISPLEKIISVLSYITMGIAGLIWIIIAYLLKKKLKYFLMYNIAQSMVISILLAIFKLFMDVFLSLIAKIPFIDFIAALFNYLISVKIIIFHASGISFTIFELLIFILLVYVSLGVIMGRIFYIPFLSDFMQKVMKTYE